MCFHEYAGGCLGTQSPRVVAALGRKPWHLEIAGNESSLQARVADTRAGGPGRCPGSTGQSQPVIHYYQATASLTSTLSCPGDISAEVSSHSIIPSSDGHTK